MKIEQRDIERCGCLFIVSGPSGAGKTSICTPALEELEDIHPSVSITTRARREREVDGVDYRFVDDADFQRMLDADEFVESADSPRPDVIKIDVESAELRVLEGARRTLETIRPLLFLETHGPEYYAPCAQLLHELDYDFTLLGEPDEGSEGSSSFLVRPKEALAGDVPVS